MSDEHDFVKKSEKVTISVDIAGLVFSQDPVVNLQVVDCVKDEEMFV